MRLDYPEQMKETDAIAEHTQNRPVISVVIITRNQARNIPRLIQSVLDEQLVDEVLLVDSASEDDTVERAKTFPIRVVEILDADRLTPAAGRRVGFDLTAGTFVLFLDGDMQLVRGWLRQALAVFASGVKVAAVTGGVINVFGDDPPPELAQPRGPGTVSELRCRQTGGMAMYRREALHSVGGFHPYLYSDEEPELCLRLQHAGFRFVKIDIPAALHFTRGPTLQSLFARRRRKLYLGQGQIIRILLRDPSLFAYLRERGYALMPTLVVASGVAVVVWAIAFGDARPLAVWLALLAVVLTAYTLRKRSASRTLYSLLHRLFIVEGAVRGFVVGAGDPRQFSPSLKSSPQDLTG
jgi:glycosyltransferase involved in cell wall biosynthesis